MSGVDERRERDGQRTARAVRETSDSVTNEDPLKISPRSPRYTPAILMRHGNRPPPLVPHPAHYTPFNRP